MGDSSNDDGQLTVAHPPDQPLNIGRLVLFYGVIPVLVPIVATYKYITDNVFRQSFFLTAKNLYNLVADATDKPISKEWYYQDATLLKKLWELSSAKAYIDNVEYQTREGYCGSATQRCILRSFGLSGEKIPPQKQGETKPGQWCEHITQMAKTHNVDLSTTIISGDVSYDDFLFQLRKGLANEDVRIGCNFLRSALLGFEKNRYIAIHMLMYLLGGHFSPILGLLERNEIDDQGSSENPFVAIFDTNHKYGGIYLVPARRLHQAVMAVDLSANNPRAIIFVEKK